MPHVPIAMKDIARLAGCSVNTVSLALRDSHLVTPATRDRIKKLAAEHGYRPNPLVSALVSSRRRASPTQTIAVLTKFPYPLFKQPGNASLFTLQLLEGLRQKATELGFNLEEFPTALPDSPDAGRLNKIFLTRGIRAVVLFPSGEFNVPFPEIDWARFAVVAAGFHSRHLPVHRTVIDQGLAVDTALAKLQERGFHRIGLAFTSQLDARWRYVASGRFFAWQALQPEINRIPVIPSDNEFPDIKEVHAWALQHRPEVVLVRNDGTADDLRAIPRYRRYRPEIVGLHLTARRDFARVDPQIVHIGRASISVVARELYLNHYGVPPIPEHTHIGGIWHEAESPAPDSAPTR